MQSSTRITNACAFMKKHTLIVLFAAVVGYLALTSYSTGIPGQSTSVNGCTCHGFPASEATLLNISGMPANGWTPGTTYSLTAEVSNPIQVAGGFDLTTSDGTFSNPGSGAGLTGAELHHTSPKTFTGGSATWTFSWTAPTGTTPTSVTFDMAGNAVNLSGDPTGDLWNLASFTFAKANPLPLGLTRFDARVEAGAAQLSWILAHVDDVASLSVERSTDGRTFTTISTDQSINQEGVFMDMAPAAGRNFYRLRLIDRGGAASLSATREVMFSDKVGTGISFFPNPACDVVHIRGTGSVSAILFDATGRATRSTRGTSSSTTISLDGVAAGIYLLYATDGSTTLREPVHVVR